jgi:predicted ATPase
MAALVDKGLLRPLNGAGGEPRFVMLETIRAYAAERLAASSEAETLRLRHAMYFLMLTEQAEAQHTGPQQRFWLERVEEEQDNIRAALRLLIDQGDAEPRLRLASAMWRLWMLQSRLREASSWLEEVLARDGPTPLLRAKVLYGAGVLAYRRGEYAQARTLHEEGLTLFRACGDRWGIARSLNLLANVALDADGDDVQARALYQESLGVAREIGDRWLVGVCLSNLGIVAFYRRDYEEARTFYEEGLALRRQTGGSEAIAESLINLARLALDQGDAHRAISLLQESLRLLRDLGGVQRLLADGIEVMAAATGLQEQPERAARLWAVATALRRETGAPLEGWYRKRNDHWLASVRAPAREAAWQAAWAVGDTTTLEQAIADALRDDVDASP